MIPHNDFSTIFDCVHNSGNNLLCEQPDACDFCIFQKYKGTHQLSKALKAYHAWEAYVSECAIEIW